MDPFWIGIVGTILALGIIIGALRTFYRSERGRGLMMLYAAMATMFVGVIWFIILNLMSAG